MLPPQSSCHTILTCQLDPAAAPATHSPAVPSYTLPFQHRSSNALSLLKALLIRDPALRLGSGADGAASIKRHPFFKGMDWKKLEAREVASKFKPVVKCSMVRRVSTGGGGVSLSCILVVGRGSEPANSGIQGLCSAKRRSCTVSS